MILQPPPGKKLIRDWIGMEVRTLRRMTNGVATVPAGSRAIVKGTSSGLHLEFVKCEHCGLAPYMTRISHRDVAIVRKADRTEATK